ncbi:MAG: AAA family ATPase, partial [Chloroflexi bacterium]|nr:AAA family ATPase [Chloroflexota bacterium]
MPPTQGERKQVTVLFADISGFTALSEKLDPENVTELINRFFAALNAPIEKYDGTIDKFLGDAVMVIFGAPRAHENDPERAIRCALEMRDAFDAEKRALQLSDSLALHIGLNTGLAIAGIVGTKAKMEYTVIGDTVNIASRLKDQAPRGEIFVSDETFRLVERLFEFRSVGSLEVKGKEKPIPTFAIVRAKAGVITTRGIAGLKSPLVGREAERAQLARAFELLQSGRGQIAFVVGEAGLGKSRLVAEIRKWTVDHRSSSVLWLEGRSLSHTQNVAYFPIIEMLKRVLNLRDDAQPDEAGKALEAWGDQFISANDRAGTLPFLKSLLGIELDESAAKRVRYLDAEGLKRQTFFAIRTSLRAVARTAPTLVFIEDLHWADDASLEVLRYVLPLVLELPLLFIFVLRPERDHGSWKLREFALRDYFARATEIVLHPLTPAASNQLLTNLLAIEDMPGAVRELILARAEGNPFYVEEIVRSLIDQKLIERVENRWRATRAIESVDLPSTLAGVIGARIDRLDPDVKFTLQIGAVIGRSFPYAVMTRVIPDPARLDADLARLEEMGLVFENSERGERQLIFKHILTQEGAYESLLLRKRRELHGQVARALEEYFGARIQDQIGLVAYHFARSDDALNAIEYALRAGERALARYTAPEAIRFFRGAWSRMDEEKIDDAARRLRALVGLGDAESARGEYDAALAIWERACEYARNLENRETLAGLHRRMGLTNLAQGKVESARKLYEWG